MAQQLDDLKKSRADLLTLIRDIDDEVKAVFLSAYEDTAAHFERIFPRLFPGGTGRMTLTDPQDPLGTGIEIEARPAGKKVTRISLLSGGRGPWLRWHCSWPYSKPGQVLFTSWTRWKPRWTT